MNLTIFCEDRSISITEQSAAGHINIIKGAVSAENTIKRKFEFLHFPVFALYGNMLAIHTKGCSRASSGSTWCIYICF